MKKAKKIFAPLAFFLALLCLFGLAYDTFLMKSYDGIIPMKSFYDQPKQSIDVLVLGSSYAGINISTRTLWDEYGIASFTLWGSVQPFWNSYYNLIEALKTQRPKLIALEISAASWTFPEEYSEEARQVTNTAGMRFSRNKWQAIQASAPPERWLDLLTMLPITHMRYSELTRQDFEYYAWDNLQANKGTGEFQYTFSNMTDKAVDVDTITDVMAIAPKQELYLNKIIQLCKQESLPLLLFKTLTPNRTILEPNYNYVKQIAQNQDVDYLDINRYDDETGFMISRDVCEDNWHLNAYGAAKVSKFLGAYIQERYDIPDRRGDTSYESWEQAARQEQNKLIQHITDINDYFTELADSHYICYLVKGYGTYEMTDGYTALLEKVKSIDNTAGGLTTALKDVRAVDAGLQCTNTDGEENRLLTEEEKNSIGLAANHETHKIYYNNEWLCSYEVGDILLIVYDPYTKSYVDVLRFGADTNYTLERLR